MKKLGVLFDVDGVLCDACSLHYNTLNKALMDFGYSPISEVEHETTFNGLPTKKKLGILVSQSRVDPKDIESISNQKQTYALELFSTIPVHPQTIELLEELHLRGIKIAACSNSLHISIEKMLASSNLTQLVSVLVGNDDVQNPKPSPDVYILGAQKLGVTLKNCVIVEDSPIGIQAATAANPGKIVVVRSPEEVNLSLLPKLLERNSL